VLTVSERSCNEHALQGKAVLSQRQPELYGGNEDLLAETRITHVVSEPLSLYRDGARYIGRD